MSNTFASLKKNKGNFADLTKKLEEAQKGGKDFNDDRFWTLTTDKAGNGTATIRFLQTGPNDDLPFVKKFNHSFKNKSGKWFIENCPTTLNGACPVCDANSELWESGGDAGKDIVRGRKRKLSYIFNIYVISDPANKENEGKVFLYRTGKKIFDRIMDKAKPKFEDETPVNVFDMWEGASFKLRAKKVQDFPNYDDSVWLDPKPLSDDDAELEKIWKSQHSLKDLLDEKEFKAYDELKKQFDKVVGQNVSSYSQTVEEDSEAAPAPSKADKPKEVSVADKPPFETSDTDSDDDVLAQFQKLADED